jgi:hypothetical protein
VLGGGVIGEHGAMGENSLLLSRNPELKINIKMKIGK